VLLPRLLVDRAAQEKAAVAGGVQQAQRQASVDAAVKRANSPEVLNRQAPAGSALRAQQDRLAAQKAAQSAAKPAPASTSAAPAPRPQPGAGANTATMKTSGSNLSGSGALAKPLEKKKVPLAAGTDLFDIVKGYLLDEGHAETEEEALYIMANMSEEWRQSIIEGLPIPPGGIKPDRMNPVDPVTGKSKYKMITGPTGKPREIENPSFGMVKGV